jgi:hypothetical protein
LRSSLLASPARSLKPKEVSEVVSTLEADCHAGQLATTEEFQAAIEGVTKSPAVAKDAQRIEAHLRELGWELEPARDR